MSFTDQAGYDVRVECGLEGLEALAAASVNSVIVVDVLSFSTCVSVAVDRGALVFPYRWQADGLEAYAHERGAAVAGKRSDPSARYSLSPASLMAASPGEKIVLPSPNGSSLSILAGEYGTVVAGCFRNRAAVARFVSSGGFPAAVIAAGERWPDGSLRPALEDFLAVGAIVTRLPGSRSPEAQAAVGAFESLGSDLADTLRRCSSGRELVSRGFGADVDIAAEIDCCNAVPILTDGCYIAE